MNLDDDDDDDDDNQGSESSSTTTTRKKAGDWKSRVEEELEALKAEGEKPIDELLKELPPEVLQKPASPLPDEGAHYGSEQPDFETSKFSRFWE